MASANEIRKLSNKLIRARWNDQWFVVARLAERLCPVEPDAWWAWCAWGEALSMLGEDGRALKTMRTGLRRAAAERRRLPLIAIADHYVRRMQPRLARKWYAQAMQEFPHDASAYIYAGYFESELGRLAEAEAHFRKAIKCRRGCIEEAWFNLAAVVAKRGNFSEARSALKRALRIDPEYPVAKKLLREMDKLAAT